MDVVCPNCGATGQQEGKYCENCGMLLTAQTLAQFAPQPQPFPIPVTPQPQAAPVAPGSARFALVVNGVPHTDEGFTINSVGEFLLGRLDQDSGAQVDVDLRRWVQPIDANGQKQYLIHRRQCFIGLSADRVVTIRSIPGSELDTLLKGPRDPNFTPLANLAPLRPQRPDGSFPLQMGDQVFMGDPTAIPYFQRNDPTFMGSYAVLQLVNMP